MNEPIILTTLAIAAAIACLAPAASPADESIAHADLDRLLTVIKPQAGESPWREIEWFTDVSEARRQAIAQDKPLVIFTAADGSPLGRT